MFVGFTWHWALELIEAYARETSTLTPSSFTLDSMISLGMMLSFTRVT